MFKSLVTGYLLDVISGNLLSILLGFMFSLLSRCDVSYV